jgi:hypothetical protein
MRLDFWNNPIVVTAFRVRFRRGGLFTTTSIYVTLLLGGGGLLYYQNLRNNIGFFPRNYLLGILGVQFVVSGIMALASTANSLRIEVAKQTFDFQRIAALTPAQILIGKLFGPSALAYLLAIASVPLSAWCWITGVRGVNLPVLMLLYFQLATTTLFFGCMGLAQKLTPDGDRDGRPRGSVGWGLGMLVVMPQLLANTARLLVQPWSAALVGLLTPFGIFPGIFSGDPWHHSLSLFGYQIPFLLVTPVSQLFLAYLMFQAVERRVVNPLANTMSRPLAYGLCLGIDFLVGAVLWDPPPLGFTIGARAAVFSVAHLVIGSFLLFGVTPGRELLMTWIWRFRGTRSRFLDLWLGERSANTYAVVTIAVLGLFGLGAFVLLPEALAKGFEGWDATNRSIALRCGPIIALVLLSLGTYYQWCVAIGTRGGAWVFWSTMIMLTVPAHVAGSYFHLQVVMGATLSAHVGAWVNGMPEPPVLPLILVYTALLITSFFSFRSRMIRRERVVDQKLEQMGVVAPAAVQSA